MAGRLWVWLSILIALVLTILPLPQILEPFWPAWVLLVICYWVMALPQSVGLLTAWVSGLALDVLQNTALGEHAFAVLMIAFIVRVFYQQLRMFSRTQQSILIFCLALLYQFIIFMIQSMLGEGSGSILFWFMPVMCLIVWPWVFVTLRDYRQRFAADPLEK